MLLGDCMSNAFDLERIIFVWISGIFFLSIVSMVMVLFLSKTRWFDPFFILQDLANVTEDGSLLLEK